MRTAVAALIGLGAVGAAPIPAAPQEVTLPLAAYEALRERARPVATPTPSPPAPYSVEAAELEIHAGQESALVIERLRLSIYDGGWQTIPLSPSGSLTSVRLGALEGRVTEDRSLVVMGRGRHTVELEAVVPLVEDAKAARPTRSLSLELPQAGLVTGVVHAGGEVAEVAFSQGGLARPPALPGRWEFVGSPGTALEIRLLGVGRLPELARLPLRFEALSATLARLGRTRLGVSAFLRVEVVQGRLEALRLPLPEGLEVVSVQAGEAGWDVQDGVLVITPGTPLEGLLSATVSLTGGSREELDSPLLAPEGASRLELLTGLSVEADGIPVVLDVGAARQADADELESLPASFREGRPALFFSVRDPRRPPRWRIEWSEAGQEEVLGAQADRLLVDTLVGEAGRAAYQCWVVVRSTGSTSLTLHPPRGFELTAAERDGVSVVPGVSEQGLEVPLGGGREPQTLHLAGLLPFAAPADKAELAIPVPSLSLPVGRVEVRAVLPGERDYALSKQHLERRIGDVPSPPAAPSAKRSGNAPAPAGLFAAPPGYAVILAGWSALSSAPSPLSIRARVKREKRKWF